MTSTEGILTSPVSYYHLFALNSWTVSCGFGWSVFFLLATPYFSMYGLSPFWISFALASGPVSGLLQPIFGLISDVSASSWGRRRPWILFGLCISLFGMILFPCARFFGMISSVAATSRTITITLAVIALWFFNIGLNMIQVCGYSMIVDKIEATEIQRAMTANSVINSIASAVANGLGFVNFVTFIPFINQNYEAVFYLGIIIVFLFCLPIFFISEVPYVEDHEKKERDRLLKEPTHLDEPLKKETCVSQIREMMKGLLNMKRIIFLILIFSGLIGAAQSPWQFFFSDYVAFDVFHGDPNSIDIHVQSQYQKGVRFASLTLAITQIMTFLLSLVVPDLIYYIGYKAMMYIAFLTGAVGLGFPMWSRLALPYCSLIFALITSFFQAICNIVPYSLMSLSVDGDEIGLYLGINNALQVSFQLLSNFIAGLLMNNSYLIDTLGIMGKISPGIAFSVVYLILAIPFVVLLDIPLSYECPPEISSKEPITTTTQYEATINH